MTAVPATLRLRREGSLRSRAARGDAAAFAAVYERHHQALYRYCRSILRHEEDAQDALQSTMTKAYAALQDERRDFELKPWLFRIAHNEAVSILRRRRETTELGDVPELTPMEDRVMERDELRALQMDLADLPDRQRAALILRELNGLSHAEIGAVLDLTPTAVKHTIFEARSALFTCREGREMRCHDVRRMLSDGDGRVLRGRGVRAHLRSCRECRAFREDLTQRPVALKLLAPPLPSAAAASLLAQLLGGGTAAKVLCCIALAGGGATLAVEVQHAREAPRAEAAEAAPAAKPKRVSAPPPRSAPAAPVVVAAQEHAPTAGSRQAVKEPSRRAAAKTKRPERAAKPRRPTQPARQSAPGATRKTDAAPPGLAKRPEAEPPGQTRAAAKQFAKEQRAAAKAQRKVVKQERKAAKPEPPGQAKQQQATSAPRGQAKQDEPKPAPRSVKPPTVVELEAPKLPRVEPPGQVKEPKLQPPGQTEKDRDR